MNIYFYFLQTYHGAVAKRSLKIPASTGTAMRTHISVLHKNLYMRDTDRTFEVKIRRNLRDPVKIEATDDLTTSHLLIHAH